MEGHIILKDTHNRGYIDILLSGIEWGRIIRNVKRPYNLLVVDKNYSPPDDVQILLENISCPTICVNNRQYGRLLADKIWLYRSPSVGLIFQIRGYYKGFDHDVYIYS